MYVSQWIGLTVYDGKGTESDLGSSSQSGIDTHELMSD